MTFLDLAEKVLSLSQKPLTAREIWQEAQQLELLDKLESKGKTPHATLAAQLYTSISKENTRFQGIGKKPIKFFLSGLSAISIQDGESLTKSNHSIVLQKSPSIKNRNSGNTFKESDLHPLLVYFAKKELNSHCKTIDHSKSNKKKYGEWIHPDIVGCSFPIGKWDEELLQLSAAMENTSVKFLSFELKKELNLSKLREYFFQTVSNSSWANESYLVAAKIDQHSEFQTELSRLSTSFGIGVIELNTSDPDHSSIVYPAKTRDNLDWDTVNKLTKMNPDFREFVKRVRIDVKSNEIRKELYDKILDKKKLIQLLA